MRTTSRWVLVLIVLLAIALGSCVKASNHVGTGMVWVATQGDQKLTSFSIDLTTGTLSQVGGQVATGVTPAALAMTPDRKTVFLANSGDNTISAYTISSDGSLKASGSATSTLVTGPTGCTSNCTLGQMPVALTVDPTGKFLFVADQGQPSNVAVPGGVSVFSINGTSLTYAGPSCPSAFTQTACPIVLTDPTTGFSTGPAGVVVSPVSFSCSGGQTCYALYVANSSTNTVSVFQYFVDSSGTFNAIPAGASPYTVGSNPTGLAFSRCAGVSSQTSHCAAADGNNLFVSNTGSDSLTVFTACIQVLGACTVADGSLLPVSGTAPATGIGPIQVIVDPVIDFVYTVDRSTGSGQVSQFSYSPLTSALTALTPPAVSTGSAPAGGGISSDGSTLLVANNGGSNLFVFRVSQPSSSGSSSGTGRLIPANPESVSVSGQPSAVLVR